MSLSQFFFNFNLKLLKFVMMKNVTKKWNREYINKCFIRTVSKKGKRQSSEVKSILISLALYFALKLMLYK